MHLYNRPHAHSVGHPPLDKTSEPKKLNKQKHLRETARRETKRERERETSQQAVKKKKAPERLQRYPTPLSHLTHRHLTNPKAELLPDRKPTRTRQNGPIVTRRPAVGGEA